METKTIFAALLLCFTAACATGGGGAPPRPVGPPQGDTALYRILGVAPLSDAAREELDAYQREHRREFLERIAVVAEDSGASVEVRHNAVTILGEQGTSVSLSALRVAARDPDPRVRAAVVVAAWEIEARTGEGGAMVEAALADPAVEVQAKAVELLGAAHLPVLRRFLASAQGEARTIALGVVRAAEERGAPLEADSAGVLRRSTESGASVEFRPAQKWAEWDVAVGTVTVRPPAGEAFAIDSVEVVAGVVPVFFSPQGDRVVYERARTIYVRELGSGVVRQVGSGVAPRPLPFTDDFIFMREVPDSRREERSRVQLTYEVMRAGFAGGEPSVLGTTGASVQMTVHGGAAPVRWMRVNEANFEFSLVAEGLQPFRLPAPFGRGANQ